MWISDSGVQLYSLLFAYSVLLRLRREISSVYFCLWSVRGSSWVQACSGVRSAVWRNRLFFPFRIEILARGIAWFALNPATRVFACRTSPSTPARFAREIPLISRAASSIRKSGWIAPVQKSVGSWLREQTTLNFDVCAVVIRELSASPNPQRPRP